MMYNAVLENATSEQGARMSAMDSSSRNAGDMLDRLTLTYNRSYFSPCPYHTHLHCQALIDAYFVYLRWLFNYEDNLYYW